MNCRETPGVLVLVTNCRLLQFYMLHGLIRLSCHPSEASRKVGESHGAVILGLRGCGTLGCEYGVFGAPYSRTEAWKPPPKLPATSDMAELSGEIILTRGPVGSTNVPNYGYHEIATRLVFFFVFSLRGIVAEQLYTRCERVR